MSQDYWDFIIPDYRETDNVVFPENQACIVDMGLGNRGVYLHKSLVGTLTIAAAGYNNIPNCYALLDMDAMNAAGISALQNYPTLQLQGTGIMIGFIDTGIDYQNMLFRNMDGSTRIAGIWDQTIQTGTLPDGFYYGSEYTQDMINEALRSENPQMVVPSVDTNGHGTSVASVAAGNENIQNRFVGAAPRSTLAVVKLKEAKDYLKDFYAIREGAVCFQENDIIQGLFYLHQLARRRNMPLVICVSVGTNFGGHNGQSILSRVLGTYARIINRCVVVGGGNEASQRHHYYGVLNAVGENREAEIRVEGGNTGFVAELWTTFPNIVTAYLVSPSGERSPTISIRQGSRYRLTFPFDATDVEVEYRLLPSNNNSQLIFLKFQQPSQGVWRIGVESINRSDGIFHIWLSIQEFLDGNVYFLEANPDYTLTEPGSTAESITVAYYNSVDNSVDINSGRGYTRNNLIKPDFAAPGVQILGANLSRGFTRRSGSSMAAGITAGGAALVMEWLGKQPASRGVTTSQVANIMIFGANQEVFPEYPNREWGYGTMDLYQSLNRLRRL